jgi:hypothetical protein
MTLDVVISTAGWQKERFASLANLVRDLKDQACIPLVSSSEKPEHANVWAVRAWEKAERLEASHILFLNDDTRLHPRCLTYVRELVTVAPDAVWSLHGNFPAFAALAEAGHRVAQCYWPSGPAYVIPKDRLWNHERGNPALLRFVSELPKDWFSEEVNEDGVLASWLWACQTPSLVTIPALVRHDRTVPSTLGYDDSPNRASSVDWESVERRAESLWADLSDKELDEAPYVDPSWMGPGALHALDEALRGLIPLCGFCGKQPSAVVHPRKERGVCLSCAGIIARAIPKSVKL